MTLLDLATDDYDSASSCRRTVPSGRELFLQRFDVPLDGDLGAEDAGEDRFFGVRALARGRRCGGETVARRGAAREHVRRESQRSRDLQGFRDVREDGITSDQGGAQCSFDKPKLQVVRGGAWDPNPMGEGCATAELGFCRDRRIVSLLWKRRVRAGVLASAGILVWAYGLPTLLIAMERTAEALFGA